MPAQRFGFIDCVQQARLAWLTQTAFPAVPVGCFLGLYSGVLPNSDGTGGSEIAIAARPALALAAAVSDGQGRWQRQNSGIISFTVPAATPPAYCVGFGIFGAASGGAPNYTDSLPSPFPFVSGQVLSLPIGAITVLSERLL